MAILTAFDRLAANIVLSFGWRRGATAFAAGSISALSMPPYYLLPVVFLTFPILVWLIDSTVNDPKRGLFAAIWRSFTLGWWFGFGYFLAGLWWIGNAFLLEADQFAWMLPFAVTLLPAGLACFYGLATLLARIVWRPGWRRLIALGFAFALAEWARGTVLTGFPWNNIGYAAMPNPMLMQKVSVLGLYGVVALSVPVFAALAVLSERQPGKYAASLIPIAVVVLIVAADIGFGAWRISTSPASMVENVRLRIVQPAIDQSEKWSLEVQDRNFKRLLDMSAQTVDDVPLGEIDLLIWPESSFPFILTHRPDALAALGELLPDGTSLIAGAVRLEADARDPDGERAFNSVYVINSEGIIEGASDKLHLVPFGEYLPFQRYAEELGLMQLTHLRGGFQPGSSRRLLDGGSAGRLTALICYEIIFPGAVRSADARSDWLLNVTNDAWFGLTPGPYQHWHQAIVRGVEEGLPVVRVANSGISSVSDSLGRTVSIIGLGKQAVLDTQLPQPGQPTLFFRFGDLILLAVLGVFSLILAYPSRR